MKYISEYDQRQLRLMHDSLVSFEKKQIPLSSLIGNLEFLLNALESVDNRWKDDFLEEITILETINALEIMRDSGEETIGIEEIEKNSLIDKSVSSLKYLVENELNSMFD